MRKNNYGQGTAKAEKDQARRLDKIRRQAKRRERRQAKRRLQGGEA